VGCFSERSEQDGGIGQQEFYESSTNCNIKSSTCGGIIPSNNTGWAPIGKEQLCRKVENKLNI